MRTETRRQRYSEKKKSAKSFPIELAVCNFQCDENVAFAVRSAACFGAGAVNVIGSLPAYKDIRSRSGTTQDLVSINQFKNPHDFLEYIRKNNIRLISAELDDEAVSIYDFKFVAEEKICIVLGHEVCGIPVEVLNNSERLFIEMPGSGFCLNTATTGSILLYEYCRQMNSL